MYVHQENVLEEGKGRKRKEMEGNIIIQGSMTRLDCFSLLVQVMDLACCDLLGMREEACETLSLMC